MSLRRHLGRLGLWLCATFAGCMTVWYVWLEPPTMEYTELPFQILTPVVKQGQTVEYVIRRINHTRFEQKLKLDPFLVNVLTGEKTDLLNGELTIPPGPSGKIGRHTVAKTVQPGFYEVCGSTDVPQTLPFITRSVPWCTQTFQVAAAEAGKDSP